MCSTPLDGPLRVLNRLSMTINEWCHLAKASVRLSKGLDRFAQSEYIIDASHLATVSDWQLVRLKNFGAATLEEFRRKLIEYPPASTPSNIDTVRTDVAKALRSLAAYFERLARECE